MLDSDIFTRFLKKHSPINSVTSPRITLRNPPIPIKNNVTVDYMHQREALIKTEEDLLLGSDLKLNAIERELNEILMDFKDKEFETGLLSNGKDFPAAHHFFLAKDSIEASDVFKIIQRLPKGGALHMHDFTVGPADYVAQELTKWTNLYMCSKGLEDEDLLFRFFPDQPDDSCNESGSKWESVSASTSSQSDLDSYFSRSMSMVTPTPYVDYPDTDRAWYHFEKKITTISGIVNYEPAFRDFYYQTLKKFYEDNVMYIEMRGLFNEVYRLNGTFLTPLEVVQLYKEETDRFIQDFPGFFGAKVIFAPHRFQNSTLIGDKLKEALGMKAAFPNFFAGFDLVGQEDKGGPLLSFMPQLLDAGSKGLQYFFHAGETDWFGTPIDENLFDAILLNTKRIGNGYALTSYPPLVKMAAEKGIAVEICPISNQVLRLVDDIRNHPGKALLQSGFPVVIASDGPGIWGSKGLSHDWYYAFMGMAGSRADLKFLKQLAINSIKYSAMSPTDKNSAMAKWTKSWDNSMSEIVQLYNSTIAN